MERPYAVHVHSAESRSPRFPVASLLALLLLSAGCAAETRPEGYSSYAKTEEATEGAPTTSSAREGCAEDDVRSCTITIKQASGVVSCWTGVEVCSNGAWGECLDMDAAAESMNAGEPRAE